MSNVKFPMSNQYQMIKCQLPQVLVVILRVAKNLCLVHLKSTRQGSFISFRMTNGLKFGFDLTLEI